MRYLLHVFALWLSLILPLPVQASETVARDAIDQAIARGSARVLVMLHDEPAAATGKEGRLRRQAEVRARVSAVLADLSGDRLRLYRRFNLVPAFAIEANAATLARLRDDPRVRRVDLDAGGAGSAVAPDEASVLNNVSPLQSLGLDGAGLKVAVIDSGIDTDHVDLAPRLVAQQCFCSGSGGCCPNGNDIQTGAGAAEDGHGHGTNVTGIVMGQGNVAPRGGVPGAELVAVRVLDNNNSFCCTSDVIASMDWVAFNHPDVDAVNMSVGTSALFSGHCDNANANNQALAAAANALAANGAVVVSSAGNEGNSSKMSAPACVSGIVSVGATWDFTGGAINFLGCSETSTAPKKPACFSNRSTTTDLYGAGAFVTSTGRNGGTSTFGGTSMASPMAAACAIALKQAVPASTVAQRAQALVLAPTTVTDTVSGRSYPFLDCVDAVDQLLAMAPPILSLAGASVTEGDGGVRTASFIASLSRAATGLGVSFTLATGKASAGGNAAVAGQDFAAVLPTPMVIPAGQSTAEFRVKIYGDRRREADEIFWVTISDVSGADSAQQRATGLILDDDGSR